MSTMYVNNVGHVSHVTSLETAMARRGDSAARCLICIASQMPRDPAAAAYLSQCVLLGWSMAHGGPWTLVVW